MKVKYVFYHPLTASQKMKKGEKKKKWKIAIKKRILIPKKNYISQNWDYIFIHLILYIANIKNEIATSTSPGRDIKIARVLLWQRYRGKGGVSRVA